MSFVRNTERRLSVVEMRQAYPQLRPSGRYQRHTARNFDGARTIAPLKRSKFEVILEPEEHFRIGNRLKAVLLFGARAACLGGARKCSRANAASPLDGSVNMRKISAAKAML